MTANSSPGAKPGKAMAVFSLCSILQKCMPFLLMPVLTRLLSVEDYGVYSVYTAWLSIAGTVFTLNLHLGVFNNGMHRFPKDRKSYAASMLTLSLLLAGGGTLAVLALQKPLSRLTGLQTEYLLCMMVQVLFQQAFYLWLARERYEYRFRPMVIMTGCYGVLSFVFPVAGIWLWGAGARTVIYSAVLLHLVFGVLCGLLLLKGAGSRWRGSYFRYALGFNLPLLPHYLSSMLLSQLDRTMIGAMCGSEEAAVYSVAYLFSLGANFAVSSVNAALVPWTYESMGKGEFRQLNQVVDLLLMGFALLLGVFVLVVPEVMEFVVTPDYYEAVYLVPPIAASSFFIFLYNLFANVEFYYESKYAISLSSIGAAVLNLLLNLWLIPKYGYGAAAYTTGFCYGRYALFHYWNMSRLSPRPKAGEGIYHRKKILFVTLGLLIFLAFAGAYYSVWQVRYGCLALLLAGGGIFWRKIAGEVRSAFRG